MDYLGLLLFILFIVVGGLRRQKQPVQRTQPRPGEALPPVWQPWVEEEQAMPVAVPELAPVPQYSAPPPQQLQRPATRTQRPNRSKQLENQSGNEDTYQTGVLDLNLRGLQRAVVMAEVLGPPKALKNKQRNRLF